MITDDPDTPGAGHWEINLPVIAEFSGSQQSTSFPRIDLNYGWGDRIQLKFETGWVYASDSESGSHRGFGSGIAGVKWRFLDQKQDGISVSTYPQLEYRQFLSDDDSAINGSGSELFLPIELAKEFGFLKAVAEGGFIVANSQPNEWDYGFILASEFDELREAMIEIHGLAQTNGGGTELLLNAGTKYGLTETLHILASFGHTLKRQLDEPAHFIAYLGVQLKL